MRSGEWPTAIAAYRRRRSDRVGGSPPVKAYKVGLAEDADHLVGIVLAERRQDEPVGLDGSREQVGDAHAGKPQGLRAIR